MNRLRGLLLVAALIVSLALAYLLRDLVHALIIVPMSYAVWLSVLLYGAIPELVKWSFFMIVVCIVIFWQLIPDPRPAARSASSLPPAAGPVETLAVWILRARQSNYFKWQLANRLGRIARRLQERTPHPDATARGEEALDQYLAAGVDHSFVDFPAPRNRLARRIATPLDLDPTVVVQYLESQLEISRGGHAKSL